MKDKLFSLCPNCGRLGSLCPVCKLFHHVDKIVFDRSSFKIYLESDHKEQVVDEHFNEALIFLLGGHKKNEMSKMQEESTQLDIRRKRTDR